MATKKKTGKKVATRKSASPANVDPNLPAFIQPGDNRGNENVTNEDIQIPRLDLTQALSECLKKKSPYYIEGIEVGDFFNSLTREVYGPEVYFIPVHFQKGFTVWVERDSGGGFRGYHPNAAAAQERVEQEDKPCEILETAMQYGLVVHGDDVHQVTIPMSRSKLKASRQLNSLCLLATNEPRFARVYKFTSFENEGAKGDYQDLTVEFVGFVTEEQYEEAGKMYEVVKAGQAVMHDADIKEGAGEEDVPY